MLRKKKKTNFIKELFKKKSSLNFNKKRGGIDFTPLRRVLLWIVEILASIGLGLLIAYVFFSGISVSGVSMEPTLKNGDRVMINRLALAIPVKRGDVIAFNSGNGNNINTNIKRVIGIPGDSVYISNGYVFINGAKEVPVNQDIEFERINEAGVAQKEIVLNQDEYFLLGDNRNNSEDSRYETIGNIRKVDLVGKVWLCYTLTNFGPVK